MTDRRKRRDNDWLKSKNWSLINYQVFSPDHWTSEEKNNCVVKVIIFILISNEHLWEWWEKRTFYYVFLFLVKTMSVRSKRIAAYNSRIHIKKQLFLNKTQTILSYVLFWTNNRKNLYIPIICFIKPNVNMRSTVHCNDYQKCSLIIQ